MPGYFDPFSGIWWGYDPGEDAWGGAINESLRNIAYRGVHKNIKGTVSTPPASPVLGDTYIIGANPSGWGAISPSQNQLVVYGRDATTPTTLGWFIIQPRVGMPAFDESRNQSIEYKDGVWKGLEPTTNRPILSDATITGDGVTTPLSVQFPAQVQSDWNATGATDPRTILNKPPIPRVTNKTYWVGGSLNVSRTFTRSANEPIFTKIADVNLSPDLAYADALGNLTGGSKPELRIGYGGSLVARDLHENSSLWLTGGTGRNNTHVDSAGERAITRGVVSGESGGAYQFVLSLGMTSTSGHIDRFSVTGTWYAGLMISE